MAKKTPQAEDAFRLRRHSILVGGALRVVLGEVEIIFQELFVTIRSALLQLLPVSDTFFGNFFTLFLERKITDWKSISLSYIKSVSCSKGQNNLIVSLRRGKSFAEESMGNVTGVLLSR